MGSTRGSERTALCATTARNSCVHIGACEVPLALFVARAAASSAAAETGYPSVAVIAARMDALASGARYSNTADWETHNLRRGAVLLDLCWVQEPDSCWQRSHARSTAYKIGAKRCVSEERALTCSETTTASSSASTPASPSLCSSVLALPAASCFSSSAPSRLPLLQPAKRAHAVRTKCTS